VSFSLAFYLTSQWWIAGGILVTLLVAGELAWRVGHGGRAETEALRSLVGGIAAATLGMLGLLLGFTLSMAISRYDARRAVIVDEANAIGTLWLRAGSSLENHVPAPIILLLVGVATIAVAFFGWSFGAAEQRSTTSMVALALLDPSAHP